MINQVRVVSIPVSDQEKAKVFFTQTLGLECVTDAPWGEGMRWIEVAPKGSDTTFSLVNWFPNMQPGGMAGLVLGSSDLEADVKLLEGRGVQFMGGIQQQPDGRFALFQDPDGNGWMLFQK
jgi:predicted enzyme related to lactoylglutathione lyase